MVDCPPRGDHSEPARYRAAAVSSKPAQLGEIIVYHREEYVLKKVFDEIGRYSGMVEDNSLLNRVVYERRVLPNESIPRRLLALQATRNKALFCVGHGSVSRKGCWACRVRYHKVHILRKPPNYYAAGYLTLISTRCPLRIPYQWSNIHLPRITRHLDVPAAGNRFVAHAAGDARRSFPISDLGAAVRDEFLIGKFRSDI
jgi:hypothetical protein